MATGKTSVLLTAIAAPVVVLSIWQSTMAQSEYYGNVIITMSSCLDYINGKASTPSSACCSQLPPVAGSQLQCLCEVLGGGSNSFSVSLNQTQALALPSACHAQTPSASRCNNSNG